MLIVQPLRDKLNAMKGSGRWRDIATKAECDYFTVARIARGAIGDPGSLLVERLLAAIKETEPHRATRRPTEGTR
jgi:hypothetical protein